MVPPGLFYVPKAVSVGDHRTILHTLESSHEKFVPVRDVNSRRVLQFGYLYDYASRGEAPLVRTDPIPEFLQPLVVSAQAQCRHFIPGVSERHIAFNQIIVNRYRPKEGISAHTDRFTFGPIICCFSFGRAAKFEFSRDNTIFKLLVQSRSLYIMSDQVRTEWKHAMTPLTSRGLKAFEPKDRYSVTLRVVTEDIKEDELPPTTLKRLENDTGTLLVLVDDDVTDRRAFDYATIGSMDRAVSGTARPQDSTQHHVSH